MERFSENRIEKPVRHAVSIVIKNGRGETLFALRSPHKDSYPSTWSLPSHYVSEGEELAETVRRIGEKKLGVALEPVELINEGKSDRGNFTLFMHDYEARVAEGEPRIVSDDYTELKWAEPHKHLESMEVMGDCCRLYKESLEADKSGT